MFLFLHFLQIFLVLFSFSLHDFRLSSFVIDVCVEHSLQLITEDDNKVNGVGGRSVSLHVLELLLYCYCYSRLGLVSRDLDSLSLCIFWPILTI